MSHLFTKSVTCSLQLCIITGGSRYGRTGRQPPSTKNRGFLLFKYLSFGLFWYENRRKAFSKVPDPHQGLCSWTSLGALPQTTIIGSRSTRSPWSAPYSPLANHGSAPDYCIKRRQTQVKQHQHLLLIFVSFHHT